MAKYRKKPVIVEAIQFTEEMAIRCLCDREPGPFGLSVSGDYHPVRRTVSHAWISIRSHVGGDRGVERAEIGDWIINSSKGEFFPCKPDDFEARYEDASLAIALAS